MKTVATLLLIAIINSCSGKNQSKMDKDTIMQKEEIFEWVKQNKVQEIREALDAGMAVDTQDIDQRTLLLLATIRQQKEMIQLLVERGADVNKQDEIMDSPFLYAGATGQTEVLQLFLDHGASFDVFNRYHGTALIPACERGHVETVRLLANTEGFPIDHINRLGWTGLMEAIVLGDGSQKYQEIVQILKDAGANMTLPDHNGVSPLQHAKDRGFTEIVEILSN